MIRCWMTKIGQYFADNNIKCIFFNEKYVILIHSQVIRNAQFAISGKGFMPNSHQSINCISDDLVHQQIDGLVQDCSNSSALAMELLQSCAKPTRYKFHVA